MSVLQKLDVMNNDLHELPAAIGELRKLECIYAQHNDIQALPTFAGCDTIKEIHISNNFIKVRFVCYYQISYQLPLIP